MQLAPLHHQPGECALETTVERSEPTARDLELGAHVEGLGLLSVLLAAEQDDVAVTADAVLAGDLRRQRVVPHLVVEILGGGRELFEVGLHLLEDVVDLGEEEHRVNGLGERSHHAGGGLAGAGGLEVREVLSPLPLVGHEVHGEDEDDRQSDRDAVVRRGADAAHLHRLGDRHPPVGELHEEERTSAHDEERRPGDPEDGSEAAVVGRRIGAHHLQARVGGEPVEDEREKDAGARHEERGLRRLRGRRRLGAEESALGGVPDDTEDAEPEEDVVGETLLEDLASDDHEDEADDQRDHAEDARAFHHRHLCALRTRVAAMSET